MMMLMMNWVQVLILEGVERVIGFTQMDSIVLRTLEQWFQSQLQVASEAAAASSSALDEANALYSLGRLHFDKGTYSAGEAPARRAVEICASLKGAASLKPQQMTAYKTLLASLLQKQGKLEEARPLFEENLETCRRTLGNAHLETMTNMNNFGSLLQQLGELEHARKLFEESLQGLREKMGSSHPFILILTGNVAEILRAQGKLGEARALHEQSVEGQRKTIGSNHPDTLRSMWNLATLLQDMKEHEAAAALLRECLEGRLRVLGPKHPSTIMCKRYMDERGIQ
jgi:tetratricopeptide (TPR) repeat protein